MVKTKSYFVLFEYAEADSVCSQCLNKCLKNEDKEVLRQCGEVVSYTRNSPDSEYAKFCDFCEKRIKTEEKLTLNW